MSYNEKIDFIEVIYNGIRVTFHNESSRSSSAFLASIPLFVCTFNNRNQGNDGSSNKPSMDLTLDNAT